MSRPGKNSFSSGQNGSKTPPEVFSLAGQLDAWFEDRRLLFEYDSYLNQILLGFLIFSQALVYAALNVMLENPEETGLLPYLFTGGVTAIISLILKFYSSSFYVIDVGQEKILYHFAGIGFAREFSITPFSEIAEVSLNSRWEPTDYSPGSNKMGWKYTVIVLLKSGSFIELTRSSQDFDRQNDIARALGEFLNIPFTEGRQEHYAVVREKEPGRFSIEQAAHPWHTQYRHFFVTFFCVAAVFGIVFIYALATEPGLL